ncbi:MAG: alpha/beta hydrolase [Pseudomonadota bacterium]
MKNHSNGNTNVETLLERNGISICYKTFGIPTNPCIILIMGLGGQLIDWPTPILQGLANNGFYVIVFDNRDAGLSRYYDNLQTPELLEALIAKEQGRTIDPPYTLDAMAADVIMLMDGLEIKKAHIVGVSMGGMIGQILALQYPERILSLTCIASTSGDPHLPPAKSEVLALFFAGRGPVENMESVVNHRMQIYKVYNHPDDVNVRKAREHFIISYQRADNPEGFTRQLLAIIFAEPRLERLKQLKLPTLIIHGDYDPAFSLEHGKQLAKLIPQARLEIIKKMGHGLPVSVYKKLVELIANHCKS